MIFSQKAGAIPVRQKKLRGASWTCEMKKCAINKRDGVLGAVGWSDMTVAYNFEWVLWRKI